VIFSWTFSSKKNKKMVRKLKHHEQKLLKKVDFAKYGESEMRENLVTRKYFLQDRNDYKK
jgi:U3 small nucleolar ribonucleoprotein protein IMP3